MEWCELSRKTSKEPPKQGGPGAEELGTPVGLAAGQRGDDWRAQAESLKDGATDQGAGQEQEQVWGAGPVWAARQTCGWRSLAGTWIIGPKLSASNIN